MRNEIRRLYASVAVLSIFVVMVVVVAWAPRATAADISSDHCQLLRLAGANDSDDDDTDQARRPNSDAAVTDAVRQGLQQINESLKCRNRCQQQTLRCMYNCPNGAQGNHCR